jgi:hypothetical protein
LVIGGTKRAIVAYQQRLQGPLRKNWVASILDHLDTPRKSQFHTPTLVGQ